MDESDRWMDRWRERGTGCATSCLDPLVPSSVHIERHSEGHGCLWKCLCELLPGRKYLRSFAAWNLKTAGPIKQRLSSPCITLCTLLLSLYCLRRASSHFLRSFISPLPSSKSPFLSVRGEFKFPRAAAAAVVTLWCRITTKLIRNHEQRSNLRW